MKDNSYRVIELNMPLTKVISIKIDAQTLRETDSVYRKHGFRSRSEFIREAIVMYIELLKKFDREEIRKILLSILDMNNSTKKR